jgi:8-oxo-dGTP diphosphatase
MTRATAPIDVAVGVVSRRDAAVLLGQRVPGKPYAGWWEFPGGKLEPGESVGQALARELHEELGLRVNSSLPWVVRDYLYPHAAVRLHFRRVVDFDGEPSSREGQAFVWRSPRSIDVAPLLPATVPVIGWLRTPTLCVQSSFASLGEAAGCAAIERALSGCVRDAATRAPRSSLEAAAHADAQAIDPLAQVIDASAGMPIVLLDEPLLEPRRFESLFYRVRALCDAHRAPLLVGDSHPRSFARAAEGVTVSAQRLERLDARPPGRITIAHCRSRAQLALAARLGLDLAIAPAAASPDLAARATLPVFREIAAPTTGLTACVAAAWREGAHGVALPASFWHDGLRQEGDRTNRG